MSATEPALGHRAQGQRVRRQHRCTRAVHGQERDGVRPGGRQNNPQGGGSDGVQSDTGPGERKVRSAWFGHERTQSGAVQGGVEQGGVDGATARVALGRLGQDHLGEHLVATPPCGAQPLENGAIRVAACAHLGVDIGEVDRCDADRGPHRPFHGGRFPAGADAAGGVPYPGPVLARPGVHRDRSPAAVVRSADRHLDLYVSVRGQHERRL
ncbi:hypothetical protein GCM10009578_019390 [Streptomyces rhizosphaericus]